MKPEILKLIEEKEGESLGDMGTGGKFLNRTAMACAVRSRIDKWDLIKLQSFSVRQRTLSIRQNSNQPIGKRYLSILNLIWGQYPIYTKNSRSWTPENQVTLLKMGYRAKQRILNWRIPNGWEAPKKKKKKSSTFLAIREIQIKTTLRFHLTPVRKESWEEVKESEIHPLPLVGVPQKHGANSYNICRGPGQTHAGPLFHSLWTHVNPA